VLDRVPADAVHRIELRAEGLLGLRADLAERAVPDAARDVDRTLPVVSMPGSFICSILFVRLPKRFIS
jgi:hypothetical protein